MPSIRASRSRSTSSATCAIRSNELDEAEASFGRALDVYRKVYKGKHYRVGVALVNLAGLLYVARRDYARAERLFGEAFALYAEVLPADHQERRRRAAADGDARSSSRSATKTPSGTWQRRTESSSRNASRRRACSKPRVKELAGVYDALQQPEKGAKIRREHSATTRRP